MKTPVERLFQYIQDKYPDSMPNQAEQERLLMSEKIQQQLAYNQGFLKAKHIYEKID
jgi:hypothetical protein